MLQHDIVRDYATSRCEDLPGKHRKLVETFLAKRPRAGQIMIRVSAQSEPIDTLDTLRAAAAEAEATLPDPVTCPSDWIGFCLVPQRIEHWQGSRDRVHSRSVFTAGEDGWVFSLLQP